MIWKFYLGLVGLLVVGSLVLLPFEEPHAIYPWAEYIYVPVTAIQAVGLYGYVFRRSLLSARFWQLAFPAFALSLLGALLIGGIRFAVDRGDVGVPAATIFLSMFVLLLFLPLLLANYRYAFRSPTLWSDRPAQVSRR